MTDQAPVMVLVTMQRMCARLIRTGAEMALKRGCPLKVVHVAARSGEEPGDVAIDAQTLDYLYALAGEVGAEMCVLSTEVPVVAMADYAQEQGVKRIVMGDGEYAHSIAETLSGLLPGVQVLILESEE